MKAQLIKHVKAIDEFDNIIEVKIWQLPEPTKDRPHGYKYSLVYIVDDIRIIGYDNAEGKGDHIHHGELRKPCEFKDIDKLLEDFYKDIGRVKHESQKSKNRD